MLAPSLKGKSRAAVGGLALAAIAIAIAYHATRPWRPDIPRVWDAAALVGWATPLAGLGQAPTHLSAGGVLRDPRGRPPQLSALHAGSRTGRLLGAPAERRPQPLIEPESSRPSRTGLPPASACSSTPSCSRRSIPRSSRWRATSRRCRAAVRVRCPTAPSTECVGCRPKAAWRSGFTNCSACHLLYLPDNTIVAGASSFAIPNNFRNGIGGAIRAAERTLPGEAPFALAGSIGEQAYQAYGAPWANDPAGEAQEITRRRVQRVHRRGNSRRRRGAVERQHPLSREDPRPHRHRGAEIHRPYRHASAPRHRRPDALRGARELCRRRRLRRVSA